ncbi:MAG: hypothetical protein RBR87_02575 [Bacteroidales bacterium]|nr:hypothetical protein [Bacteroidales bacterium]
MTPQTETLPINRKALNINLDSSVYGSFAEIGGGQETARNFFQAGGASGTIAKTISAYDKSYSDAVYCKQKTSKRYVSRERLELMLDAEYSELTGLLKNGGQPGRRFFSFANTVSTLNYYKDNISHGWMGVRFQLSEGGLHNEVILHVLLLENDNVLQQNTLGILGVNMIYACYYFWDRPNAFLQSLLDNLSRDRIAITMINMSGPELSYVDNRLLGVQLVKNDMTKAIMFDRHGQVQEPDDMLYKKNVLIFRGSFRPITYVTTDMLKTSFGLFKKDEDYDKSNTLPLCEITINNLYDEDEFDERDFLDRVDLLNEIGQNVMVSNFREFYKLVGYMSQFRTIKTRLVIGLDTFKKVMDESYYTKLKGGILEALGNLFPENVKVYLYPALDEKTGKAISSKDLVFDENVRFLFEYLVANRKILDIPKAKRKYLTIKSSEVLDLLRDNNPEWEEKVPVFIADRIKERKLFGYSTK